MEVLSYYNWCLTNLRHETFLHKLHSSYGNVILLGDYVVIVTSSHNKL